MPTAREQETIDQYWAAYFGCTTADLYKPQTLVVDHAAMGNYQGLFVFHHPPACIVSTPPEMLDVVQHKLGGRSPEAVCDLALLEHHFAPILDRFVGPAWLGYAGPNEFHPATMAGTRLLTASDDGALRQLAARCEPVAWEHSGLQLDRPPVFGHLLHDEIVAAAGYEIWGGAIAHIGVITDPANRGRGFGKSVASAAASYAFAHNLIAQYRTLNANTPSIAIGKAFGFQGYATTIAVRLTSTKI
jgi:GNAT superfamily N-acetyltransferase